LGYEWNLAPKIPWNPEHFFRFRKYWPSTAASPPICFTISSPPLLIAIARPNGEYPMASTPRGLYIEKDGRDIPDTFMMTADYPGEWSLFLVSTLTNDAGIPAASTASKARWNSAASRRSAGTAIQGRVQVEDAARKRFVFP